MVLAGFKPVRIGITIQTHFIKANNSQSCRQSPFQPSRFKSWCYISNEFFQIRELKNLHSAGKTGPTSLVESQELLTSGGWGWDYHDQQHWLTLSTTIFKKIRASVAFSLPNPKKKKRKKRQFRQNCFLALWQTKLTKTKTRHFLYILNLIWLVWLVYRLVFNFILAH